MAVKASIIINWVDTNLPPLTWRIVVMKQMKLLMTHKIFPAKIDEHTLFNDEIILGIRETLKKDYNKDLPDFK